ncbi:MAG: hypothetical protein ACKO5C_06470 [Ferruginibacter sp.]
MYYYSHLIMKKVILLICLVSLITAVSAQFSISENENTGKVVFPVLENYSNKFVRILPTWQPSKKFLKDNPNFLKDGSYKLNSGMVSKMEKRWMDSYPYFPSRFLNINAGNFPAIFAQSDKKLDFLDMAHFTFTMNDEADIPIPLDKKWRLVDEVSIELQGLENLSRRLDERFQYAAQKLAAKKSISNYETSPITSSLYGDKQMSVNGLVFDFQCMGLWSYTRKNTGPFWILVPFGAVFVPPTPNFIAMWLAKHNGGNYFPSNALYQLNVKDVTGNLIKSYRQAIFIGEKHVYHRTGSRRVVLRDLFLNSLPVAMESLVNQFLNDEQIFAITKKHLLNLADKERQNPNMLELAKAQARVNMFYRRKTSFVWRIGINKNNIIQMGNFSSGLPQATAQQQQLNNAIYSTPQQQQMTGLTAAAGNLIGGMIADAAIRRNTQEANRIAELYRQTEEVEGRYIGEISNLIQSDANLAATISQSKTVNQFFQDELRRVALAKEESQQKTAALKEAAKEGFSKTLTDFAARNNIDLAQMSAMAAGETPPANAGGNPAAAKSGKTSTDACVRQFEAAWRNSAEYKKYKASGLQADAYMLQWKQGMLILQYCGSVLPEADKAAIRKVAEQCRQNAETMRKSNNGGIRY